MIRDELGRLAVRVSGVLGLAIGLAVFLPATVAAHTLNATYTSRLPLAVYLVGAAPTVALSFIFVIVRDVRASPPVLDGEGSLPPAWLRHALRALGLIGWFAIRYPHDRRSRRTPRVVQSDRARDLARLTISFTVPVVDFA